MTEENLENVTEFIADKAEAYNEWATESAAEAKQRVSWENTANKEKNNLRQT